MEDFLMTTYTIALPVVLGYIVWLLKEQHHDIKKDREKVEKERAANSKGTRCLLREDLIVYYDKYMQRGTISKHAYENLVDMSDAYEALGGNGTVKKMVEELKRLPIEEY